jgi:hypothetical protein
MNVDLPEVLFGGCLAPVVVISAVMTTVFAVASYRRTRTHWTSARPVWVVFWVSFQLVVLGEGILTVDGILSSGGNSRTLSVESLASNTLLAVGCLVVALGVVSVLGWYYLMYKRARREYRDEVLG